MQIKIRHYKRFGPIVQSTKYRISANSFRGNYSFVNLEIVENSSSCHKFKFLSYVIYWIFAAETNQWRKLFAEIQKLYNGGGSSNDCIKKQINLLIIVVKWLREGEWVWTWLHIDSSISGQKVGRILSYYLFYKLLLNIKHSKPQ